MTDKQKTELTPEQISEWGRLMQAKRKNRVGGFKDEKVRAKAQETKRRNATQTNQESGQGVQ